MYGIPQAGQIKHDAFFQHLATYGYHPSNNTLRRCTNYSRSIDFTLVVDNFGGQYSGKYNSLHLRESLEDKYKVTTDCKVKLYIRILLQWDYEKGAVQLYMPGYVCTKLYQFQQEKQNRPQDYHTPGHNLSIERATRCRTRKKLKNTIKIIKNGSIRLLENSYIILEPFNQQC